MSGLPRDLRLCAASYLRPEHPSIDFLEATSEGKWVLAKWLARNARHPRWPKVTWNRAMGHAGNQDNREAVGWVLRSVGEPACGIEDYLEEGIEDCVGTWSGRNRISLLIWLRKQFDITLMREDSFREENGALYRIVRGGRLRALKWLCTKKDNDAIAGIVEKGFEVASSQGQSHLARYLVLTYQDTHMYSWYFSNCITKACYNNDIELADWLQERSRGYNNIAYPNFMLDDAKIAGNLLNICEDGGFEVLRWIYRTYGLDKHVVTELKKQALRRGLEPDQIEWISGLRPVVRRCR